MNLKPRWQWAIFGGAMLLAACGRPEQASARIGPAGGVVRLQSGLSLVVPEGAMHDSVDVTVREVEAQGGDRAFEIEPAGTELEKSAKVEVEVENEAAENELELESEHGLENELHGGGAIS